MRQPVKQVGTGIAGRLPVRRKSNDAESEGVAVAAKSRAIFPWLSAVDPFPEQER